MTRSILRHARGLLWLLAVLAVTAGAAHAQSDAWSVQLVGVPASPPPGFSDFETLVSSGQVFVNLTYTGQADALVYLNYVVAINNSRVRGVAYDGPPEIRDQAFDRVIERFRQGMQSGVVETKMTIRNVIGQLDTQLAMPPEQSPYYGPVREFPEGISEADQARLRHAHVEMIRDQMLGCAGHFVVLGQLLARSLCRSCHTHATLS